MCLPPGGHFNLFFLLSQGRKDTFRSSPTTGEEGFSFWLPTGKTTLSCPPPGGIHRFSVLLPRGMNRFVLLPPVGVKWTGSQTTQLQVAVAFLQNSRSRGEAARSDFSASLKKSWECRSTCGPKAHT